MSDASAPLPHDRAQLEILLLQEQIKELKKGKRAAFSFGALVSLATAVVSLLTAWSAFQSERTAWQENAKSQGAVIAAKEESLQEKQAAIQESQAELVLETDKRQELEIDVMALKLEQQQLFEELAPIRTSNPELDGVLRKHDGNTLAISDAQIKDLADTHVREFEALDRRGLEVNLNPRNEWLDRGETLQPYADRIKEWNGRTSLRPMQPVGGG